MFVAKVNNSRLYEIVAVLPDAGKAYYYLLADKGKSILLGKDVGSREIELKDYGTIVYSGFGDPPDYIRNFLQMKYNA